MGGSTCPPPRAEALPSAWGAPSHSVPPPVRAAPAVGRAVVARRALAYWAPTMLLLAGALTLLHLSDRASVEALVRARASHVAELAAAHLARDLAVPHRDVRYLADQRVLADYLDAPKAARSTLESEWALFLRTRGPTYDQVRLLGLDGRERVRVHRRPADTMDPVAGAGPIAVPAAALQSKAERYYFRQSRGLPAGEVYVSPLDLNVEHGRIESPWRPVVRFATPTFDRAGVRRGVVVLNFLAEPTLAELDAVAAQGPGETWLVDGRGQYLRGVAPERRFAWVFGRSSPSFAAEHPDAWAQVVAGRRWVDTEGATYASRAVREPSLYVVSAANDAAVAEASRLPPLLLLAAVAGGLLAVLAWWVAAAEEARRAHEARLHALSQRLMRAQEEERRAVARDLHDELGQVVTALHLHLRRLALASDEARRGRLLDQAVAAADQVITGVRELGQRVRPSLLDDLGLADAVRSLAADFERRSGLVTDVEIDLGAERPPVPVADVAYRILQEAMTNAWRHAGASTVRVVVRRVGPLLELRVADDGGGMPAAAGTEGLGLLGMRERAELVGGTLTLLSALGEGTEVVVRIPLPPRAPK